ncbi:MAG: hypothetical protein IKI18_07285, partial [Prevotella sp.]|nr:hypothetical protein [Prevotella sp.]
TVPLVIGYEFTSESDKVGFTFSLRLPEGLSLECDEWGDPIYVKDPTSIDKMNILFVGTGNVACQPSNATATIKGTSGTLLTLNLVADASLAVGTEITVPVAKATFQQRSPESVTDIVLDDFSFKVTIGEPVDSRVVLDEKSTTVPEASSGAVDVRVNRTLVAGNWNTICLPFAMTGSQVTSAFGNDVQLADFSDWTIEEDGEGNIVRIVISFENVAATGGMEANHPYLIKVSQPVTEFTADGVTITPEEEPMTMVKHGTKKRDPESYMIGTYAANTVLDEFMLFLNGNKFWYSSGLTKMKAFRAYFNIYDILTSVENAEAKVFFTFAETTGIKNVNDGDADGNIDDSWYTIDGQKLNREPVQKGIYIHQGKKINK